MKDGNYDLTFSADGYTGRGTLMLAGQRVTGHDGQYALKGTIFDGAAHLTAVIDVSMGPQFVANSRLPEHYALQMTGTTSNGTFSLIGTGPLGLIVEMACVYAGPLTDGQLKLNG